MDEGSEGCGDRDKGKRPMNLTIDERGGKRGDPFGQGGGALNYR